MDFDDLLLDACHVGNVRANHFILRGCIHHRVYGVELVDALSQSRMQVTHLVLWGHTAPDLLGDAQGAVDVFKR